MSRSRHGVCETTRKVGSITIRNKGAQEPAHTERLATKITAEFSLACINLVIAPQPRGIQITLNAKFHGITITCAEWTSME